MKKVFAIALCLLMILPLFCGCTGETSTTTGTDSVSHTLRVGYGRVDITPNEPVPLSGYSDPMFRFSTTVTHRLYATCIALTDEADNTILLFHLDLLNCDSAVLWARSHVSKVTGIPYNQVITATTHTHSGPSTGSTDPGITRFNAALKEWMVEAAQAALNDRKEAQVFTTSVYPQGLNYVRHYVMNDGSVTGDNFGISKGKTIVGHVSDADNAMQLIKFTRNGGKDIVLMNWQGHPHRDGGTSKTNLSSDIVGVIREELEAAWDCQFAYFTGASGNVNNHSRIEAERITKTCDEHGKALAKYAMEADNFVQADVGTVQYSYQAYQADSSHAGHKSEIPMTVFSIGDVGFVIASYEMFDTNGMEIKNGSPFAMTFIVTCANGRYGYIPNATGFQYDDVVSYEAKDCAFAPGTGEVLAKEYLNMLNSIYKTRK